MMAAANRCERSAKNGDLVHQPAEGQVPWHKPIVYQKKDRRRKHIQGNYLSKRGHQVGTGGLSTGRVFEFPSLSGSFLPKETGTRETLSLPVLTG